MATKYVQSPSVVLPCSDSLAFAGIEFHTSKNTETGKVYPNYSLQFDTPYGVINIKINTYHADRAETILTILADDERDVRKE